MSRSNEAVRSSKPHWIQRYFNFTFGVSSYEGQPEVEAGTTPGGQSRRPRYCPGQAGYRRTSWTRLGCEAGLSGWGWGGFLFKLHRRVGPSHHPCLGLSLHTRGARTRKGAQLRGSPSHRPSLRGKRRVALSHDPLPLAREPSKCTHTCPRCRRWVPWSSPKCRG